MYRTPKRAFEHWYVIVSFSGKSGVAATTGLGVGAGLEVTGRGSLSSGSGVKVTVQAESMNMLRMPAVITLRRYFN